MGKKCCSNQQGVEDMRSRESQKEARKKKNKNGKKLIMTQVSSNDRGSYLDTFVDSRAPMPEKRET